jgi:type I restriction enzyme S subunit
MKLTKLSELLDISIGRTPSRSEPDYWGKGYPWVSIRDLSSKTVVETKEQITDQAVSEVRCKLVPKGTLLFSFKLTIGKMSFAGCDLYTNEAIAAFSIKNKKKLHPDFLYYALQAATYGGSNQAVMGKTLNSKSLADIAIPVPPLEDQIRIAHLLGKVEALISQRKQHLKQFDDLLKSVFLEMFGDPVSNEKGWEKATLEKLGSVNRGVSKHRPRNDPKLLGGNYPLIQTGDVSNAGTYITAYTQTYSDIGFAQSKLWPAGTLCITIAANIAQTGILTFDACFPDSVVGFVANKDKAHPLFIHGLFGFFQAILEKNAPAAAQKNINLEILRGLEVPKPPIANQNEFALVVEKIEALKNRYQHSLVDLEALYSAFSQQAFKGQLVF